VDHSRVHRGSVSPDNLLSLAGVGHRHSVRMFCLSICLFVHLICLFMIVYSHSEADHSRIHRGSVGPDNLLSLAGVRHRHSVRMFVCPSVCLYLEMSILSFCLSIPIPRWIILWSMVVRLAQTTYFIWQVLDTAIW
jgi:hypothetical protein